MKRIMCSLISQNLVLAEKAEKKSSIFIQASVLIISRMRRDALAMIIDPAVSTERKFKNAKSERKSVKINFGASFSWGEKIGNDTEGDTV